MDRSLLKIFQDNSTQVSIQYADGMSVKGTITQLGDTSFMLIPEGKKVGQVKTEELIAYSTIGIRSVERVK